MTALSTLDTFTTRVRQMILRFQQLKQEKHDLEQTLAERDQQIASLQQELEQARLDYESLKMARMLTVSGDDVESAQKRISAMIRDVNRCITLLNGKE